MTATFCLALGLIAGAAPADAPDRPFLHPLFTDHAVLQRDVPIPVWGWTEPGQTVKLTMDGKTVSATADSQGKWMARLAPLGAGGPYLLTVAGPKTVQVKDILMGDVWVCSGQSNMEWPVVASNHGPEEVASADHPKIRLFSVPKRIATEPTTSVEARWEVCSPATIGTFSAVGYFFGRDLERELNVPIGLINSSWGGTVAEAWTSAEALESTPDFHDAAVGLKQQVAAGKRGADDLQKLFAEWWKKNDPGSADTNGFSASTLDDSSWKTMKLPNIWESSALPDFDGVVWFRKEFDLPDAWAGKELLVQLGPIDDRDTTWVNGQEVGHKDDWQARRDYKVPPELAKAGRNSIAVRVLDTGGNGGFQGRPEEMKITLVGDASAAKISLAGDWKYRETTPKSKLTASPVLFNQDPNTITVLYNGMIAPLGPFAIKGAIWYQGESNVGRAEQYRRLLPAMIGNWRSQFGGGGDFPFLIVQLANFMPRKTEPSESPWAELQEAQWLISKHVPKVGLAVINDIGDAADIHPRNKQDVGKRLALNALKIAHGKNVENSGPSYKSMEAKDGAIKLTFDHLGGGLEIQGGGNTLTGFAVAGDDGKYVWAVAKIEGDTVVVKSDKVPNPKNVRYAWADNPECNFTNKAGLPAVPFRTDGVK